MITIKTTDWLRIPENVAKCPECGYCLFADVFEYESASRKITEAGFHLSCLNEEEENPDTWHRHWQSDWQDIITDVYGWMSANVRVSQSAPNKSLHTDGGTDPVQKALFTPEVDPDKPAGSQPPPVS